MTVKIEIPENIVKLMERGVMVHDPLTVHIGSEVDIDNISGDRVVLYGGTRLAGSRTVISAGVSLGEEGPVTVVDCRLGREVALKGGYFRESVFLDRASMGSGSQVREGCLIEEEANGAHTVGLKQTILFPFVTLGSLINFCDCLMAGGTSRKDHSEVGSSYIHFNYTPNQDKATASLIGDVPRGVMLRERPIFLGGQGGLVGPARIGYGTVVAAGTILRNDVEDGCLISGCTGETGGIKPFQEGLYVKGERKIKNNIEYIANLIALQAWYRHVRRPFFDTVKFGGAIYEGARETLTLARAERIKRLGDLAAKMSRSVVTGDAVAGKEEKETHTARRKSVYANWPRLEEFLGTADADLLEAERRDAFLAAMDLSEAEGDYPAAIRSLDGTAAAEGTAWLAAVVDTTVRRALRILFEGK